MTSQISIGGFQLPITNDSSTCSTGSPADHDSCQDQHAQLWLIVCGEYDDTRPLGIVEGTETHVLGAVDSLNTARLNHRPNDHDPYAAEKIDYLGTVTSLQAALGTHTPQTPTSPAARPGLPGAYGPRPAPRYRPPALDGVRLQETPSLGEPTMMPAQVLSAPLTAGIRYRVCYQPLNGVDHAYEQFDDDPFVTQTATLVEALQIERLLDAYDTHCGRYGEHDIDTWTGTTWVPCTDADPDTSNAVGAFLQRLSTLDTHQTGHQKRTW